MTVTARAQETTVELIDKLCALRDEVQSLDGEKKQQTQLQIRNNAQKLVWALQEPNAAFWELVRKCSILSPIKVAQDMGIFGHLLAHDHATADELASATGGEKALISKPCYQFCRCQPFTQDHQSDSYVRWLRKAFSTRLGKKPTR